MTLISDKQEVTGPVDASHSETHLSAHAGTIRNIAYLIPEFPGQTHAFFWREKAQLERLGFTVGLASTRRPPADIISHTWSADAMRHTLYLYDGRFSAVRMLLLAAVSPLKVLRCLRILLSSKQMSWRQRLGAAALIPFGIILARHAGQRGWEHIHAHSAAGAAFIAMFCHIAGGPTYSITLHGAIPTYGAGQDIKWLNARFGITVNQRLRVDLLALVPELPPDNIAVAPMGVDVDRFTRTVPYEPWTPGQPLRLITCGRLHTGKRHQDVIEAAAILVGQGIDARLTILGEGPARAMLEEKARAYGVSDRLKLPGAVDEAEVVRQLQQAHIFVLASDNEALGVATMEAMAMELPVVVTDVGGVSELVRHGIDGLLSPPLRPIAIADAVVRIIETGGCASEMSSAGADRVRRLFHSGVSARAIHSRLSRCGDVDVHGHRLATNAMS